MHYIMHYVMHHVMHYVMHGSRLSAAALPFTYHDASQPPALVLAPPCNPTCRSPATGTATANILRCHSHETLRATARHRPCRGLQPPCTSAPHQVLAEPNEADPTGRTPLTLWGSNFAPVAAMACVFQSDPSAPEPWRAATAATVSAADRLACLSPQVAGGVTGSGTVRLFYSEGACIT